MLSITNTCGNSCNASSADKPLALRHSPWSPKCGRHGWNPPDCAPHSCIILPKFSPRFSQLNSILDSDSPNAVADQVISGVWRSSQCSRVNKYEGENLYMHGCWNKISDSGQLKRLFPSCTWSLQIGTLAANHVVGWTTMRLETARAQITETYQSLLGAIPWFISSVWKKIDSARIDL